MAKREELSKQIHLYSLETVDFYTDEEKSVSNKVMQGLRLRNKIKSIRR